MEKLIDSFAVFTKIICYVSIFLKINFKDVQQLPIQGDLDFRVTNNNFFTYFFLREAKIT